MKKKEVKQNIEGFFTFANYDTVSAIRAVCRKRFPSVVAVLDGLSVLEWQAVKNGGLQAIADRKQKDLCAAMMKDHFVWQ